MRHENEGARVLKNGSFPKGPEKKRYISMSFLIILVYFTKLQKNNIENLWIIDQTTDFALLMFTEKF